MEPFIVPMPFFFGMLAFAMFGLYRLMELTWNAGEWIHAKLEDDAAKEREKEEAFNARRRVEDIRHERPA